MTMRDHAPVGPFCGTGVSPVLGAMKPKSGHERAVTSSSRRPHGRDARATESGGSRTAIQQPVVVQAFQPAQRPTADGPGRTPEFPDDHEQRLRRPKPKTREGAGDFWLSRSPRLHAAARLAIVAF